MKIIDLLNKWNNGKFEELPNEIIVANTKYHKNDENKDYYSNVKGEKMLNDLLKRFTIEGTLKLKVKEIKEKNRWKPKKDKKYWFVNVGKVDYFYWYNDIMDNYNYNTRNCFKTREETETHRENIETYYKLKNLAEKLNKGRKIDWNNSLQVKYYLSYNYDCKFFVLHYTYSEKTAGQIYCLDKNFKDKAIEEIGASKLIQLVKEK